MTTEFFDSDFMKVTLTFMKLTLFDGNVLNHAA